MRTDDTGQSTRAERMVPDIGFPIRCHPAPDSRVSRARLVTYSLSRRAARVRRSL